MKISTNWLKDYVDINFDLKELADKITKSGVNVEQVKSLNIDNLVIAQIEKIEKHPDSDHLNICMVNTGTEILQVVCGASNVKEGIKVILALPNAILPGGFEIKKSTIRKVESNGMICALYELGLEEKSEETYKKGIHILNKDAKIGENPLKYLNLDDTIYELDLNPNRSDCLSHVGFSHEVAAILNKKVTMPDINYNTLDENIEDLLKLKVETDNCPLYNAKIVKNVTIKESPDFIKQRLVNSGMRPINNVVDISNYIMLEYGQPLHFFDKDKLGNNILVRMAQKDEKTVTLDEKERILNDNDIVITDGDKIVCIAGVMGSLNTEVDNNTKNIVIESAIFNPYNIRYTSINLNLRSESSIRYEKGLNYEYTNLAIERACHLLEKYADGRVVKGKLIHDKIDKIIRKVLITKKEVNSLLGMNLICDDIEDSLNRLSFPFVKENDNYIVTIPSRRMDVEENKADIIEEIGRLYGYDKIRPTLPISHIKAGRYIGNIKNRKLISKRLRDLGLNETRTYTLVSEEDTKLFNYDTSKYIKLLKPMSLDKSIIRQTLLASMLKVIDYNLARGEKNISIYEISNVYSENAETLKLGMVLLGDYIINNWQNNHIKVDFYLLKGMVESILDYLGFKNRYDFISKQIKDVHPYICVEVLLDGDPIGFIGKIHPSLSKEDIYLGEFNLDKINNKKIKPLKYKEVSKYPNIIKDLAFVVDKNMSSKEIEDVITKSGGRILTNIEVFDVYNIDDKKSIAYELTFSDQNKTLTDVEVSEVFNKIIYDVENKIDAKLRN